MNGNMCFIPAIVGLLIGTILGIEANAISQISTTAFYSLIFGCILVVSLTPVVIIVNGRWQWNQ